MLLKVSFWLILESVSGLMDWPVDYWWIDWWTNRHWFVYCHCLQTSLCVCVCDVMMSVTEVSRDMSWLNVDSTLCYVCRESVSVGVRHRDCSPAVTRWRRLYATSLSTAGADRRQTTHSNWYDSSSYSADTLLSQLAGLWHGVSCFTSVLLLKHLNIICKRQFVFK